MEGGHFLTRTLLLCWQDAWQRGLRRRFCTKRSWWTLWQALMHTVTSPGCWLWQSLANKLPMSCCH